MAASNDTNPVYTRLVDDSSSLLIFEPASAWNHTAGPGPNLYVNSTHSSSDVSGATCKFSFNGTGFWIMGAKKADYGQYLILLDDAVQQFANATAQQTLFGQVLGGASGLDDGSHTVVFMAAGGGPVDIDAIVYERTDKRGSGTPSGIQTASVPPSSNSPTASVSPSSSSPTSVSSSQSSQSAPTPSPSSGNRISANPHAQGPNEPAPAPSQNASAATPSSSPSATSSVSSIPTSSVSGATASSSVRPSQPNAQPSGQDSTAAATDTQATAHPSAQPTAQPNAQPSTQPGPSGPTQSSTSSAFGPSMSQAEHANSPQIAGMSKPQKGLPLGAVIGISIGAAVALLLLVALLFCLMRRRRRAATARRRMTAGQPSPILPLQDPARHASYFFGGYGSNVNPNNPGSTGGSGNNGMRELYLAQGPQSSFASGATARGGANPYNMPVPKPMPPAIIRESVYTDADTATLASEDGYITDASSKTVPTRPPRPPDLRLSVV